MVANLAEYVTVDEAARLLGYHPYHVRDMLRKKKLKADKLGTQWLIYKSAVLEYKKANSGLQKHDPRRS